MDTDRLHAALENAGVTQYEADAYVALLEHGTATASELAEASDVPQTRIYDVVRSLAEHGYAETYQEDSLTVRANDPEMVVEDLESYADTFLDAADEIEERWTAPDVKHATISVVSQPETVLRQAREWIESAQREIEISATVGQFQRLRDGLCAAHERGVVIKLTLTRESDAKPPEGNLDPEAGEPSAEAGASEESFEDVREQFDGCVTEVRYRDMATQFITVVDREHACFAPETTLPESSRYGVLVDDASLSRVFYWFFETALWNTWGVVYSTRTDELPAIYSNIRECLHHVTPLVESGHRVVLTVDGIDLGTDEHVELTGEVADIVTADYDADAETLPLESLVHQATIWLDVDGETYTIGGWGSYLEDVEGERFTVESVEENE
jgi:sugar-specific transcriptional regulator TrmB